MVAGLAPISLGSSIVGFISFAFTFLTLIRVFWDAIITIFSAPTEARDILDNLRQELYELREALKHARKKHKGEKDEWKEAGADRTPLRVLQDTVKHMSRDFRILERPFLQKSRQPIEEDECDSAWTHYAVYTAKIDYCNMDLSHRIIWLRTRSKIMVIGDRVNRIQVRRIAHELTHMQT